MIPACPAHWVRTIPTSAPASKLTFRSRDGNCASCHTPMASKLDADNSCGWNGCHMQETSEASDELPAGVSPNAAVGVAAEGIACDFCHKIGAVALSTDTLLPDPEMPGHTFTNALPAQVG